MKKISKVNELAWVFGILFCQLGISFCTKANLGLSMIAAPAYIAHIGLRDMLPWFTQGTADYIMQGIILVIVCLVTRRFRPTYLLSFATAFISGKVLDGWLWIFGGNGAFESMAVRVVAFVLGLSITALGVAMFFRTSMPLQVYELAVSAIAEKFGFKKDKVKMANDMIMLALSVLLAVVVPGGFSGIGVGTVVITFVNAPLIMLFGRLLDKFFDFTPMFPKFFEKNAKTT